MLFKIAILVLFILIILSLVFGAFFLKADDEKKTRLAIALTIRVFLSLLLFILLFVGYFTGQLVPHNL